MAELDEKILGPALAAGGIPVDAEDDSGPQPSYRVVGDTRVPVSKYAGALWRSRRDQALAKRKATKVEDSWQEALDYFFNDQIDNRQLGTAGKSSRSRRFATKSMLLFSETENLVFANTKSLVPLVYAKNPKIEITARNTNNEALVALGEVAEELVNALFAKEAAPGIAAKNKFKRCVVLALLTNAAYAVVDYTQKTQSSEQAQADLEQVLTEWSNAKSQQEIIEAEGKLRAIEDRIEVLSQSGPTLKIKSPFEVLFDPFSVEDDNADAKWGMYSDMLPTAFIQAEYGVKNEDGTYSSVYMPTHILSKNTATTPNEEQINSFSLFNADKLGTRSYGQDHDDSVRRSQMTKVWYVLDRCTRRVLMFNDNDWSWPIWVWDDPWKVDKFFNITKLSFYTNPLGGDAKGEVTYYLDQQDAINEINSQFRFGRNMAINALFYDSRVQRTAIEAVMKGDEQGLQSVKVPEGMKIEELIHSYVPPVFQHPELLDKTGKYEAIDRISSLKAALSGQQFKTNTTNKAIDNYNSTAMTVLDEKVDALEDFIGRVGWQILQLCLQYMQVDEVNELLGKDVSAVWRNMSPKEIRSSFAYEIVGGSTTKPTSQAKKQEAIQVGQVLGQFVQSTPYALMVVLKLFEQAFDEIIIESEDWQTIKQSLMQQMQNQQLQAEGQIAKNNAQVAQTQQGAAPAQQGDASSSEQLVQQVEQLIDSLPPQAKEALGQVLAQGVPFKEALTQLLATTQQQTTQQQQA